MPRCVVIDGYRSQAVTVDGTNDWLTKTGGMTSDSNAAAVSFWFRLTGASAFYFINLTATDSFQRFYIRKTAGGTLSLLGRNAANANAVSMATSTTVPNDGVWRHFAASWNTTTGKIYIDGSDVTAAGSIFSTNTTNFAANSVEIFNGLGFKYQGDISDLWLATTYLDLTVAANLEKFRSSSGKPVFLGTSGEVPTGSTSAVYLSGPASGFHTNKGSAGGYTLNGSFTDASTSPSD